MNPVSTCFVRESGNKGHKSHVTLSLASCLSMFHLGVCLKSAERLSAALIPAEGMRGVCSLAQRHHVLHTHLNTTRTHGGAPEKDAHFSGMEMLQKYSVKSRCGFCALDAWRQIDLGARMEKFRTEIKQKKLNNDFSVFPLKNPSENIKMMSAYSSLLA